MIERKGTGNKIEGLIRELKVLGIHLAQFDVSQVARTHRLFCLLKYLAGKVNAYDVPVWRALTVTVEYRRFSLP
jgi:hypothetical protein